MSDDLILGLDAFIRSVGINRSSPHTLLLGAGASISSGVPSAASCIWEWKRSLFLTKNVGLEEQFAELSLPTIRAKIQRWLDAQHIFPSDASPEEYGIYIKECYPIADDRRAYFQERVRQASPHIGYRLLIKLAEAGIIQSVWTTNFDGLTAKAAANSKSLSAIEVGIDCQERLPRKPKKNELVCVSLHGDYRYDQLKNTPTELQEQEKLLRAELVDHLLHAPFVTVGCSGRDASLMAALEDSYSAPGTGVLYWCGFGDSEIPKPVRRLLDVARSSGRAAYYVQAAGFDDLMLRIALHCLKDDAVDEARAIVMAQVPEPIEDRADFTLVELPTCGIIKSNAFPFTPPGEVYEFDLKEWPTEKVWDYFDACTQGRRLVAVPFKKAYAFGTIDDIRAAFSDRIAGKIERVPINEVDLRYEDGALTALVRSALIRAMATRAGVSSDGKKLLWESTPRERRKDGVKEYLIHEAVLVFLRRVAGRNFVVLKPTVRIASPTGEDVPRDSERNLKMAILGWQHNKEFNQALDYWRARLLTNESFEFPEGCASSFKFHVKHAPVLAKVMSAERS